MSVHKNDLLHEFFHNFEETFQGKKEEWRERERNSFHRRIIGSDINPLPSPQAPLLSRCSYLAMANPDRVLKTWVLETWVLGSVGSNRKIPNLEPPEPLVNRTSNLPNLFLDFKTKPNLKRPNLEPLLILKKWLL